VDQATQQFWDLVQKCQRPEFWIPAISAFGGAVVMMVVLFALVWFVRRRRAGAVDEEPQLASIDVGALAPIGPPADSPRLTVYGTPVRLTILAIAPVGRDSQLPDALDIPALMDQLVPGMKRIVETHHPEIVCWPSQLSSHGFVRSFFQLVRLPGDKGRETPWCSVAGKFRASGRHYLAGLVMCGQCDNGLNQVEVRHDGLWNDILRIQES
jgi:hypothetical protein